MSYNAQYQTYRSTKFSLPSSHIFKNSNKIFTMLNYAPPNNDEQKNAIVETKAQIQQKAWNPDPNWMYKLRHSKSDTNPNVYETYLSVAYTHGNTPVHRIEKISPSHYARVNKDNEAPPQASPDFFEQQVFTSHSFDEKDPIDIVQALLPPRSPASDDPCQKAPFDADHPLRAPENSTFTSHEDVTTWDAQARNLKPSAPQRVVEYEDEGLVESILVKPDKKTRELRSKGKGLWKPKDEDKADSVVEGIEHLRGDIVEPVSWGTPSRIDDRFWKRNIL
jgi:hypothetical protein